MLKLLDFIERRFHDSWLNKVVKPSSFVVKVGFHFDSAEHINSSFLGRLAKRLGRNGLILGIEPTAQNIHIAERVLSKLDCKFILSQKALLNRQTNGSLLLGTSNSWNRLKEIPDSEKWGVSKVTKSGRKMRFKNETINIEVDLLDSIFKKEKLDISRVEYIDMTINGSEYWALRGAREILTKSKNIALSVIVGRQKEGDIGYIYGMKDYEVIIAYLRSLGFKTFKWPQTGKWGQFGYLYAWKGSKPSFPLARGL